MGKWVTIKGAHVYIEDDGSISKGPKSFIKKVNTEKETNKNYVKTSSVLNNRKNLVNYVKQQIDIDLDKVATENQFAPRRGLNIDSSKMTINELNNVKHIMTKKDIRMESNGIKDYFIYYEKKKSDETTKQKNFIKSPAQKSNEKFNSNNAATYTGTDGTVENVYVNKYMGKNEAGETLYSVYTSSGKEQIVLGKNIKVVERKTKKFVEDTKSNAQKRYDEGGPRYF